VNYSKHLFVLNLPTLKAKCQSMKLCFLYKSWMVWLSCHSVDNRPKFPYSTRSHCYSYPSSTVCSYHKPDVGNYCIPGNIGGH